MGICLQRDTENARVVPRAQPAREWSPGIRALCSRSGELPNEVSRVRLEVRELHRHGCRVGCGFCLGGASADLFGQASITDGDTTEIRGTRGSPSGLMRRRPRSFSWTLNTKAIAAVNEQQMIVQITSVVRQLPASKKNIDQCGRVVVICSASEVDIWDWLVRRGLATDYAYFSKWKYREAEAVARTAHIRI